MPWPGSPKSQQSPPINPPSMRSDPSAGLNENSSIGEVVGALKTAFDGLTVHEQAFANLPSQVASQAAAAATTVVENLQSQTTEGVTAFNSMTGAIIYFPGLGTVTDELGSPDYTALQTDAGAKIVVGDSSPVTVYLDPSLVAPWFCIIDNDSSAVVTLAGNVLGAQSIYPGGFATVFYDGATFWSGATGGATGTIRIPSNDSGMSGSITVNNGLILSFTNPT